MAYQFSSGKLSGSAFGCSNVVVVSQKTCSRALLRMHSITSSECRAMSPEARGVQLFEKIEGDYFTILGMPLLKVQAALRRLGEIEQ